MGKWDKYVVSSDQAQAPSTTASKWDKYAIAVQDSPAPVIQPPAKDPLRYKMPFFGDMYREIDKAREQTKADFPAEYKTLEDMRRLQDAVGGVVGGGLLAKGAGNLMKARGLMQGAGVLPAMGRGAVEGAAASQIIAPEKGFFDPLERGRNALIGGGISGALTGALGLAAKSPLARALRNTSKKGFEGFQTKTLGSLDDAMHKQGKVFGKVIDDLSSKSPNPVDLEKAALDIIDQSEDSQKIATMVRRIPKLRRLLEGEGSLKLTLKESQDLYNEIGSYISKNKLAGEGLRPNDIPVLKFMRNAIRKAQVDSLPGDLAEEFAGARSAYGQAANDYKLLRGQIKNPMKFVDTAKTNFGKNPILQEVAERFVPDAAAELKRAAMVQKLKKAGIWGGSAIAGSGITGAAFKFGQKLTE